MRNSTLCALLAGAVVLPGCGDLQAKASASDRLAALEPAARHVEAVASRVLSEDETLAGPSDIDVVGGELVVLDAMADKSVHLIRRTNGALERSFGPRGRGPGEFERAWSVDPVPGSEGAFWVYDLTLRRSTYVDLEEDGGEPAKVGDRMMLIRSDQMVLDPVHIGGEILTLGLFQAGRIGHLDGDGRLVSTSGPTPLPGLDLPAFVRQHAYQSRMKPNPSRTRLAVATRHADVLEIYDAHGRRLAVGERPFNFEPAFEVKEKGGSPALASGDALRFGYVDLATTDDRIYALFSGRTRGGSPPGEAVFGRYVHVFDWTGRLRQVLELDVPILALAVTEDGRTLYGIRHDPVPGIVVFELNRSQRQLALAE